MKISFVLVCTCAILSIKKAHGSSIGTPFYPLHPEDLSQGDVREIEYWNKHYYRPKRTIVGPVLGSAGALIQLKTAAISGTKMKIIEIAKASAGGIAGASAGTHNALGSAAKGLLGSVGGIFQLKNALEAEVQKKIGEAFRSAAGASTGAIVGASTGAGNAAFSGVSGSSNAIHQLKSAAFNGIVNNIKALASGSAQHISGASAAASGTALASHNALNQIKSATLNKISGIALASGNTLNSAKNSLVTGITGKIAQVAKGSAGLSSGAVHKTASSITGTLAGSSNAIHQLKSAIINHIFGSSAQLATGASVGIKTKVHQVSGDIVAGGVDVANQLKTAVVASHKQKLGQAASGLAGAITGAVGSASAGLGQFARGGITGSLSIANQIKEDAHNKIGQVFSASAGASAGTGNAVNQLKSALLSGVSSKIAGASGAAKSTITGSAKALHQLKNALFTQIALGSTSASAQLDNAKNAFTNLFISKLTNIARGSIAAATAASGHVGTGTLQHIASASGLASSGAKYLKTAALSQVGQILQGSSGQAQTVVGGSANAIEQLKSAAFAHVAGKIKQVAQGSLQASGLASSGTKSAIAGSASAVHQLKTAALSHVAEKVKQVAQGSLQASGQASIGTKSAIVGSASAVNQLKNAALSHVTNKLGQLSKGSASASAGSAQAVYQLKKDAITNVASASVNTVQTVNGFKNGIMDKVHYHVSNLAEASAERRKRSIPESNPAEQQQDRSYVAVELPKRSESAWSSGSGSGSADLIGQIKTAVVAGLKQKLGQVAKGSAGAVAGASAGFSKGSSGGGDHHYNQHPSYDSSPHHHHAPDEHKTYNVWELKKSVLNTLLQAVKAIKGGVLAIKGQLIKGSGYVVSGGGKLIAASGDKVTKLGKNIISNAVLVHPNKEHYTSHSDYVSHSSGGGYTAPSGPPAYDAPPSGHGYESHYESHPSHYDKPSGPNHAGILILRRMPQTHDKYHSSHSNVDESVVPPFKPLAPAGPTFGTVVGKFFSASTSLAPSAPGPFTNADIHPYEHHNNIVEESHGYLNPPSPPHYEEPRNNNAAPAVYQAPLNHQQQDFSGASNNYGVPLEDPLSYQNLNFNDHSASASSVNEQQVKLTKGELNDQLPIASSEVHVPHDAPPSLQALKTSATLGPPFSTNFMSNPNKPKTNQINYLRNALFAEQEKQVENNPLGNFLPQSEENYSQSKEASNELLSSKERYMKVLENFPVRKSRPSMTRYTRSKRPSSSSSDIVKSVSYKLTSEGVTRLT